MTLPHRNYVTVDSNIICKLMYFFFIFWKISDRISEIDIKGNHNDMLFRPFLRLKQEFSARREVEDNSLFG